MTDTILRIIDLETNGIEPPFEALECGQCDLTLRDGTWTVGEPVAFLFGAEKLNPQARSIHHITPAEIAGMPPFKAEAIVEAAVDDGVFALASHNWAFENQWITDAAIGGMLRTLCTYKAALRVWPDAPSHSNGALRYWLEDQGLASLDHSKAMPPHRAGPDAYVTAHLLKALLNEVTGREMVAWAKEPRLLPTIPIGKQRGAKWADVDGGFLNWMLGQATMEEDLKWNARRELERRRHVDP